MDNNYAIIDIETNGGVKITEISIFIFDGENVIDEFTTLINPECNIPSFITNLTGINNAMVSKSPKFYEVAKKIYQITEGCVFVAHNVNFDFGIIAKEFKALGLDYRRKKLCTVRLSRRLLPNKKSYSLGNLCASEGIFITSDERHRAKGDAEATVKLFRILLNTDKQQDFSVFKSFLSPRSREATLPPLLPKEVFENLSQKHGVYYFLNVNKEIIYVGKANNIKQRVLSHFYDKKKKEVNMCLATADIKFTETGSELLALLLESAEIKKHYPKYNRAQRKSKESFGLFYYTDRKGIMHLAWNSLKLIKKPLLKFYSATDVRLFVEKLCEEYELCPKYCNLQTNVTSCFHYQIKKCKGICRESEAIKDYNNRVQQAIASVTYASESFVIKESGRSEDEFAFVLVQNSFYKGFGYLPKTIVEPKVDDYLSKIKLQKDNRDVHRIIQGYLKRNTDKLEPIQDVFDVGLFG